MPTNSATITIGDICQIMDQAFPLATQDSWDNSGLLVGNANEILTGIIISVDIDETVITEAIEQKCNMVIAHHPIMFRGIKRLNGQTSEQRIIEIAIREHINIFAAHTCADKSPQGTSAKLAQMINLKNTKILIPEENSLNIITVSVPTQYASEVRNAIFDCDGGHIGNYSQCSLNIEGYSTFKANKQAQPFIGEANKTHSENETRIETIATRLQTPKIINAILKSHPYEEPAYNIYPISNKQQTCGYGIIGDFETEMTTNDFLALLKNTFKCQTIRHNEYNKPIKKVAICTGSGSEFISEAIKKGADAYITADIKYHQFAEPDNRMIITDIGHYESEELTKQLFLEILREKIHTFVPCLLSRKQTNLVKYF